MILHQIVSFAILYVSIEFETSPVFPCVLFVCMTVAEKQQLLHVNCVWRLAVAINKSVVKHVENADIHNSQTTMAAATSTSTVDSQIEIFVQEVLVNDKPNKKLFFFRFFASCISKLIIENSDSHYVCTFRMYRIWKKRSIVSSFTIRTTKMNARGIFISKWVSNC